MILYLLLLLLEAIPLVNTELEMAHLFGLRESANAKHVAKKKLQDLPSGMEKYKYIINVMWFFSGMQDLGLD